MASLVAGMATAATVEKRTTFTFNTPVAVPGVTLPAGSYVFRLADPINAHDVVQVLSADGRTPYAMFFALPEWRATAPAEPELRFMETAADMPRAIRTWWYPGETIGFEFLYPREQARLLARGSGHPVLAAELAPAEWAPPEWIVPEDNPEAAPAEAVAEEAVTGELPAIEPEPEPAPAEELPKTDSPTMNVFLAGFLAAGAALLARTARRTAA
jgi:hypothetical protein